MNKIVERGILRHANALDEGEYSSAELISAYLEEIKNKNSKVGAYLSIDGESAMRAATESDKRRVSGHPLGKFDGIPIAIKDNICTLGLATSCGSRMLEGYIPPYDATVIERLKSAGFIVLGKTNMDEFGMGSSTENSAFGVTRNPHDLKRVSGGSSGGSAAAVASFTVPCALGSDTGGSIRQPSAFCGTVGMKPTYGAVSRYGLVAFAPSLEQIGPITMNVRDNSALLSVISGIDEKDATCIYGYADNMTEKTDSRIKGLRIAVPVELFGDEISPDVRNAVMKAIDAYRDMGAIVDEVSIPVMRHALSAYYIISSAEASSNLARFDGVRYGHRAEEYSSVEELYKRSRSEGFGAEVKRRIILGTYALSEGYYDEYYKRALRVRSLIKKEIESLFENYDIILSPTAPTTAFEIGEKNKKITDMYAGDLCCVVANLAGIPALTLPCGRDRDRLPIGIQLMGRPLSEELLYLVGQALEKSVGGEDREAE